MRRFVRRLGLTVALSAVAVALAAGGAQAATVHTQYVLSGNEAGHDRGAVNKASGAREAKAEHGKRYGEVCGAPYIGNDPRLGPVRLPHKGILGYIVQGYDPLGDVRPHRFVKRYWLTAKNSWQYPPDAGFAHADNYSNAKVLRRTVVLAEGKELDRFGGETGAYLSPLGASYEGRAIPPNSINTFAGDPKHLCNYHAYLVIRAFRVDGGPAAPAFQQEGGDVQYHLLSKYLPAAPQTDPELPVGWLVRNGYLVPLN